MLYESIESKRKLEETDNIAKYGFQYMSKHTKMPKIPNYWFISCI